MDHHTVVNNLVFHHVLEILFFFLVIFFIPGFGQTGFTVSMATIYLRFFEFSDKLFFYLFIFTMNEEGNTFCVMHRTTNIDGTVKIPRDN